MNLQEALIDAGLVSAQRAVSPPKDICPTGKTSYATKPDALARMRRYRHNSGSRTWHVYRCGVCGHYHLTGGRSR